MNLVRGDIVLAWITYSDKTGAKKRPVLVVSTNRNNAALDDVILAAISSYTRQGAFTHILVDPAAPEGQGTGLLHVSYIQCENLFTLDKGLILRKLGQVTPQLRHQVDQCLKAALELP